MKRQHWLEKIYWNKLKYYKIWKIIINLNNKINKGYDNRELFDAIIENDEDILKDYLADNGYKFLES